MSVPQAGEVSELISQAERALANGDRARADALLMRVKALDPEHPAILNETALHELRSGNVAGARELLERAVARDGSNTRLLINLAGTLRRLGLADEEMRIIERVLAVEPRHLFGLLQKASVLESQGKQRAAAKVYHNALQTIPPGTQVPGALRGMIDKALAATEANDAALNAYLNERFQEFRDHHSGAQQDRFDHCIDAFLGRRRIYTPRPTFLHFPQLPAREFYPRTEFPWLASRAASATRAGSFRASRCWRQHPKTFARSSSACSPRMPPFSTPTSLIRRACRSLSGRSSITRAAGACSTCGATASRWTITCDGARGLRSC